MEKTKKVIEMIDADFLIYANEQVQYFDPRTLPEVRIPDPPPPLSPILGDAEFEFAMMDVPRVSTRRVAVFRSFCFIIGGKEYNEVKYAYIFQRFDFF